MPSDKKPDKSYLGSAVDAMNPWAASATPAGDDEAPPVQPPTSADHSTTPLYGQSFRTYPKDCPRLKVQWFHASDVPKRKPHVLLQRQKQQDTKEEKLAQPKKFTAFSQSDSTRLEARYQKLLEAVEDAQQGHEARGRSAPGEKSGTRVPVNEDFLFDVDIEQRELSPVYWLGAIYQVRRGTWFFQEGSNLKPCEENLAAQLEEGYLKTKPWQHQARPNQPTGKDVGSDAAAGSVTDAKPEATTQPAAQKAVEASSTPATAATPPQLSTYRLFGAYMNNVATYQDGTTAWLSSEGMLSWVTSSVYERFAGGGYMSGIKLVRGYEEPIKAKEKEKEKDKEKETETDAPQDLLGLDQRQQNILKRRSAPPTTASDAESSLQRQLSSLLGRDAGATDEEMRRREEQDIQDDYNAQAGEAQGRDIEHLVLVTHGIGQRLGIRMESVNFVHDVNVLRKTLKATYTNSADLKALNAELGPGPGNCRVQVLPVCWRHLIDFPKRRQRRGECDLGQASEDEDEYPSLQDITVEGVAYARSLVSDLALDVLLYQSSYRQEISRVVVAETNRILRLFRERNPEFAGRIHVMGHSLGSAIFFDVLCRQRERESRQQRHNPLRVWPTRRDGERDELQFDCDVDDFFCLGSPVGLFQMLKGRTIAARHTPKPSPPTPPRAALHDDVFQTPPRTPDAMSPITGLHTSLSSPKVRQLFNIFHPSDPVAYRLEPLISPAMATLKPQALPYTKRSIFSVAPHGLARVGQSVSGLWSALSAGIATNLLNRSLGLSGDADARLTSSAAAAAVVSSQTDGAAADERKRQLACAEAQTETLIDDELETLYSTFQKGRVGAGGSDEVGRARKMRVEELKVRALNRNGRVDYNIQESALDFNPINTIASHMSYWADDDVSHFVLSQLLSSSNRSTKTGR